VLIYGLVVVLAHRPVPLVRAPIETKIITPSQPPPVERPPPPPSFAAPPQLFVPPPEVNIAKTPPPPQSTAPAVVTTTPPPTPAPTAPVTVQPRIDLAHSSQPEYPPQSRRLGEQGSLVLQVLVDASGRVTDAKLVQSSGSDRLDQAALRGVKANYRFVPGTVDGKPQPMWFTFKFTWKLQ
jgi:protein TonB